MKAGSAVRDFIAMFETNIVANSKNQVQFVNRTIEKISNILFATMTSDSKLTAIKTVHTVIWIFFNIVIFYLLYAVIVDKIDKWIWICLSLIAGEGLVLLIFKNICPITIVARKYSDSRKHNFDIYLPDWLAKYNKEIYTTIVLVSLLILAYRLIQG